MRKLYLLTAEEAGRLLQMGLVSTCAPKKTLGEFISMKDHGMYCLVEKGGTHFGRQCTISLDEVYGISVPIGQVNGLTTYGAVYLTKNSTLLRRRITVGDLPGD